MRNACAPPRPRASGRTSGAWRRAARAAFVALALSAQSLAASAQSPASGAQSTTAGSQSGASSAVWTLERALDAAALTHPSVRERQSGVLAAERALEGKKWLRYPGVAVQSAAASQGGPGTTVRVQMPVWTANRIGSQIDGAAAEAAAARMAVTEEQLGLALQVTDSFGELLRLRDRLSAAEQNVKEHERLRDMIRRRVDSEISPAADLLLAQARLSQAQAEQAQFRASLDAARQALAQLVGAPVAQVQAPAEREPAAGSLEELVRDALAFSPAGRRIQAETEAAQQQVASRRAALLPQVLLRYDRTFGGDDFTRDSRVSVVLEYETGAGLSAASAVAEAQARADALRHAREALEREIRRRLGEEWVGAAAQWGQAALFRQLVASSLEVKESFRRQFVVGRKSWIEVLNAEREAVQARYSLADAYWTAQRLAYRLALTAGRLEIGAQAGARRPG